MKLYPTPLDILDGEFIINIYARKHQRQPKKKFELSLIILPTGLGCWKKHQYLNIFEYSER
jgi:hypothetical protein